MLPGEVMSEEMRNRRKELRRRPNMMERARELGLLTEKSTGEEWSVVRRRSRGRADGDWPRKKK